MARNGSGVYSPPATDFPAVASTLIESTKFNNVINDIGTALSGSIAADGQTTLTANIPMNSKKLTGLAAGSTATDSLHLGQAQAQAFAWCGTAGGTANALTIAPSPAITAYAAGQTFRFKSGASPNSGATTIAISGLATIAVQVNGAACTGGEIAADKWYQITVDASATACQLLKIGKATLAELETEGAAVTAASSTNIWAGDGSTVHVTGNTGINDFATAPQAGAWMKVIFDGTPLLTQSANLNLNAGGANIQIAADDFALVYADTTTQMDVFVTRKSGTAVIDGTLGTPVATTSGTSVDYTSIPSWTKRITINFSGVSVNGTSNLLVQIGDSGGIETSGYLGASSSCVNAAAIVGTNFTTGYGISQTGAANVVHGTMTLTLLNSSTNNWAASHNLGYSNVAGVLVGGGAKALSATLDRLRITTVNGTDAFDAGEVNVTWE